MSDYQTLLLAAARALDEQQWEEALDHLRSAPLGDATQAERLVANSLWQKIARASQNGTPLIEGDPEAALKALNQIRAAVANGAFVWNAYRALKDLERHLGPRDASAVAANALWGLCLDAAEAMFVALFELFYRGGGERCQEAWNGFLAHREEFAPGYWHLGLLMKCPPHAQDTQASSRLLAELHDLNRADLAPLFNVYFMQMRQAPVREIVDAARKLKNASHRHRVAQYLTGMGHMPDELPIVVSAYPELAADGDDSAAMTALMQARLANAEGRWSDVQRHCATAGESAQYRQAASLLNAKALAHLGDFQTANAKLDDVIADDAAVPTQKARATFIKVTSTLLEHKLPLPDEKPLHAFPNTPGRPLAQSLWVGPSLRWIERLAIKSYLDNGWRFQLYVYTDPDNVPAGCEVLNANTIIPESKVFKEGQGSGLHAGSVGAFSDLFRYRMLLERGGMWTDTDVINFQKFDPDGAKFVSTEITDAGLITLNGAMMAAPAGDPFVEEAYERADRLLKSDEMFFTRIGPYLLGELFVELGAGNVELMPPQFLSAVFWMNTGSLLRPFDEVNKRPEIQSAVNLHVYTEMWRLLGLGLDKPPGPDTYLGWLYRKHFPDEELR